MLTNPARSPYEGKAASYTLKTSGSKAHTAVLTSSWPLAGILPECAEERESMGKCVQCEARCGESSLVLEQDGQKMRFCSFECLVLYAAAAVQRRIARQNRRMERFAREQRRAQFPCEARPRRESRNLAERV
jgi:hypothetical protein